jgi:hypothetical protein
MYEGAGMPGLDWGCPFLGKQNRGQSCNWLSCLFRGPKTVFVELVCNRLTSDNNNVTNAHF